MFNFKFKKKKFVSIFIKQFSTILGVVLLSLAIILIITIKETENRFNKYNTRKLSQQVQYMTDKISKNWDNPLNIDEVEKIAKVLNVKLILIDNNKDLIFLSDRLLTKMEQPAASDGEEATDEKYENAKITLKQQLIDIINQSNKDNDKTVFINKMKINKKNYLIGGMHKFTKKGKFIGTVYLATPSRAVEVFNSSTIKSFVYGALISFLFALIMAAFLSREVSKRIVNLTDMANKMADGDFSHKIENVGNDEIGLLSTSINHLSEKIDYLEKMREQYVANVSHELRTPLTGVRGLLEPVIDGILDSEEQKQEYINRAYDEILRLSILIDELLKLSKFRSQDIDVEITSVDINMLLERLKNISENYVAKGKNIEIITNLDEDIKYIKSNDNYLEEILNIFIQNAIRFSDDNKAKNIIEIYTKKSDDTIRIGIKDTGIGMTREQKEHIFDRFYQANERKNVNEGLGLGLSITKQIANLLNVEIVVESEQNVGSDFYLVFSKI